MLKSILRLVFAAALLAVVSSLDDLNAAGGVPPNVQAKLKRYDSKYYVVFSDMDPEVVQEGIERVTALGELYWTRMKGFGGKITARIPFYFIGDTALYSAAGGPPGSLGAYMAGSNQLLVNCVGAQADQLWPTVAHEMFHQFALSVIGPKTPVWINEGLADYYGYSCIWTGDGMVCGFFYKTGPYDERRELMEGLAAGTFPPMREILLKKPNQWRDRKQYVQAWSMIYYLLHADGGKNAKSIDAYLKATAAGAPPDAAFTKCIGDPDTVEKACIAWWKALPEDFSDHYRHEATVATLTSGLARARSQGQKFASFDEFLAAAKDGSIKKTPKQPLPDSLLKDAVERAEKLKTWSLDVPEKGQPKLVLTLDDGTVMTGTFKLKNNQVDEIKVDVKESKAAAEK